MERLTIEEVIAHCGRHVDRIERQIEKETLEIEDMSPVFMKEYWEHRQVKEWLLELQKYRSIGMIEDFTEEIEKKERKMK